MSAAVAGCGLFQRVEGPPPPESTASAEQLVRWLRDHVGATQSARALLSVSVRSPKGNMSFDGVLFTERPSTLRLQGFTPLGQRLFDMATRGEIVRLRIDRDQRYFEGTIDALGDGLQLPALPQLLELMASVTFAPPDPSQHVEMERAAGMLPVLLSFYAGGGEQRQLVRKITLDRYRLPVEESWYDAAGDWSARVAYADYHVVDDRWQPQRVYAHLRGDVEVKVTVKELQLDPVWRPEDFDVPRPTDVSARR